MDSAISKIKQPEPKIANPQIVEVQDKKYKVIRNNLNIGVVDTPQTSRTPIRDWVELKRQENPYTVYKIKSKNYSMENIHTFASAGIVMCGIASLLSLIKMLKKSKP